MQSEPTPSDNSCLTYDERLDNQVFVKYGDSFEADLVLERLTTSYDDAMTILNDQVESSACLCPAANASAVSVSIFYGCTLLIVLAAIVSLLMVKYRHKSKTKHAKVAHLALLTK